jgi:hypothetical protein
MFKLNWQIFFQVKWKTNSKNNVLTGPKPDVQIDRDKGVLLNVFQFVHSVGRWLPGFGFADSIFVSIYCCADIFIDTMLWYMWGCI